MREVRVRGKVAKVPITRFVVGEYEVAQTTFLGRFGVQVMK